MKTNLNTWYDALNPGELYPTYTRDTWTIPEDGAKISCTGWRESKTIKPYGDGCHVYVNGNVYHCDELMGILKRLEKDGYKWEIEGVKMTREQQIQGRWTPVDVA